jgi:restriction system protein
MAKETIWGIHGGKTGDADSFFLNKNVVAIGWHKVGDLGKLQANREAFRSAVDAAYPEKKPGSVPVNAGQHFEIPGSIRKTLGFKPQQKE